MKSLFPILKYVQVGCKFYVNWQTLRITLRNINKMNISKYFLLLAISLIMSMLVLTPVHSQEVDVHNKYLLSPELYSKAIKKSSRKIIVLDVRTPGEYLEGHISIAENIDYKNENFRSELEKLNKKKTYYLYCRSGSRSANSRQIMIELGFKNVYNLDGGINAWKKHGYPVE